GSAGAGAVGCGMVCCCESEYCAVPCIPGVPELPDDGAGQSIVAKPSNKFSSALSIAGKRGHCQYTFPVNMLQQLGARPLIRWRSERKLFITDNRDSRGRWRYAIHETA